jgi:hypothetical protein
MYIVAAQHRPDVVSGGDHRVDVAVHAGGGGQVAVEVAVPLLVVGVAGDVVDDVVGPLQDRALPPAERRHRGTRAAADHELDGRVELAHGLGGRGRERRVVLGAAVAELPRTVHLVAEAPHADPERLAATVVGAEVGPRGAGRQVGVLQDVEGLADASGAEVDGVHQVAAHLLEPGDELVETHRVGLGGVPGQVAPARPVLDRADAVLPPVAGDEVAAGVADGRDTELLDQGDHVPAEATRVGRGVTGFVDACVDAAPEVLDERPEQAPVDRADGEGGMEDDLRGQGHGVQPAARSSSPATSPATRSPLR